MANPAAPQRAAAQARVLYVHAISPVHTGTGQSAGVIDLPVAREAVYNWQHIPGSTIKGVLRDAAGGASQQELWNAFGPDTDHASDYAGGLVFSDGHLLCLPVRSYHGTFAWVTCPLALQRWRRDHVSLGLGFQPAIPGQPPDGQAQGQATPPDGIYVPTDGSDIAAENMVFLEDLDLAAVPTPQAGTLATAIASALFPGDQPWQQIFRRRFGILSDDNFTFLSETAIDLQARIKLEENTKTVQEGHLWYEEAVPAESIFWSAVVASPRPGVAPASVFRTLESAVGEPRQFGGHASVGRGLCRLVLREGGL